LEAFAHTDGRPALSNAAPPVLRLAAAA
jgi:hypothetical protein